MTIQDDARAEAVREVKRYIECIHRKGLVPLARVIADLDVAADRMSHGLTARGSTRVARNPADTESDLIEQATFALIEHDGTWQDGDPSEEHYRERRADVERVFPILRRNPADGPEAIAAELAKTTVLGYEQAMNLVKASRSLAADNPEVIERVARAIFESKNRGQSWGDIMHEGRRESWRTVARAALAAAWGTDTNGSET